MDFNSRNKLFVLLLLIMFEVCMGFAEDIGDNFIILWDYNPEMTLDYLDNNDTAKCMKKYPDFIKLDSSEFEDFDMNMRTFVFKDERDAEFFRKFEEQFNNSQDGSLFFSLVVGNKAVLNGLNRISLRFLLPSNHFAIEETEHLMIYSVKKRLLKISDRCAFDDE